MNPQLLTGDRIPKLLREISVPPKQLWLEGLLPDSSWTVGRGEGETRFLCVVGSRRHSTYARERLEELIQGLAPYNICIVSGLAIGIDSIAHESALKAGLHTIAFPGSGLDRSVLYPPSRRELGERILSSGGALLSEFDLTQAAAPWTFPQRNRLMAGISHATLVVEAGPDSGTLITAMYALDANRDVCALPGLITSPLTYGPHKLIRNGATLIRSSDDILEVLGLKPTDEQGSLIHEAQRSIRPLNTTEQSIFNIIKNEAVSLEELTQKTGLDSSTVSVTVSMLEIEGIVKVKDGKVLIN